MIMAAINPHILVRLILTISYCTSATFVSNKRVQENGIKEFSVEKEIRGHDCACNCVCAPSLAEGKLLVDLPPPPDVSQLNQTLSSDATGRSSKYFKIDKEIRKNKCSCSCLCAALVQASTSAATPESPLSTTNGVPITITTSTTATITEPITHSAFANEILEAEVTRSVIAVATSGAIISTTESPPTPHSSSVPAESTAAATTTSNSNVITSELPTTTVEPITTAPSPLDPAYKAKVANLLNMLKEQLHRLRAQQHIGTTSEPSSLPSEAPTTSATAEQSQATSEIVANPAVSTTPSLAQRAETLLNTLRMKLDALKKQQASATSAAPATTPEQIASTTASTVVITPFATTVESTQPPLTSTTNQALVTQAATKSSLGSTLGDISTSSSLSTTASTPTTLPSQTTTTSPITVTQPSTTHSQPSTTKSIVDRMLEGFRASKEEKRKEESTSQSTTTPQSTVLQSTTSPLTPSTASPVTSKILYEKDTTQSSPTSSETTPVATTTPTTVTTTIPTAPTTKENEDPLGPKIAFITETPEIAETTTALPTTSTSSVVAPIILRVGPNPMVSEKKLEVKQSSSVEISLDKDPVPNTSSAVPPSSIATNGGVAGKDPVLQSAIDEAPTMEEKDGERMPVKILLTRPPSSVHSAETETTTTTESSNSFKVENSGNEMQSSTISASDVLEQARELREEQRQLDAENSILTANDDISMAQIQQRKRLIEQKLAQLAQMERWHRELLQRRHFHLANQNTTSTPTSMATSVGSEGTESVMRTEECKSVRKFVDTFQIDDSGRWVEENCEKVRRHFPAASCAYIQEAFTRCFNSSA